MTVLCSQRKTVRTSSRARGAHHVDACHIQMHMNARTHARTHPPTHSCAHAHAYALADTPVSVCVFDSDMYTVPGSEECICKAGFQPMRTEGSSRFVYDCSCHGPDYVLDERNDPPTGCWIKGVGYDMPFCGWMEGNCAGANYDCNCHGSNYVLDERNDPPNDCWIEGAGYDRPLCGVNEGTIQLSFPPAMFGTLPPESFDALSQCLELCIASELNVTGCEFKSPPSPEMGCYAHTSSKVATANGVNWQSPTWCWLDSFPISRVIGCKPVCPKDSFGMGSAGGVACAGCGCSPEQSASHGEIADGPGVYENDADCQWIISGNATLRFTAFATEAGYDFVTVRECDDSSCRSGRQHVLDGFIEPTSMPGFSSQSGYLGIFFTSDGSVTEPGFRAKWTIADPACPSPPNPPPRPPPSLFFLFPLFPLSPTSPSLLLSLCRPPQAPTSALRK